jgi:hypothetical protein
MLNLRTYFSKGDLNETLFVGEVDEQSKLLTKVTHEALMKAIEIGKTKIKKKTFFKIFNHFNIS